MVSSVWRQPGEEYKDKFILPTVKHGGGSVMVRGYISADILKQSMIPSLQRLGRRAVFQHDNDPKHLHDDHCLAKEAEGKGDGQAKHVSRATPYWASVGHPQMEGGGAESL